MFLKETNYQKTDWDWNDGMERILTLDIIDLLTDYQNWLFIQANKLNPSDQSKGNATSDILQPQISTHAHLEFLYKQYSKGKLQFLAIHDSSRYPRFFEKGHIMHGIIGKVDSILCLFMKMNEIFAKSKR